MPTPLIGVYPGTFDPVTNGHMDIIKRATKVVDRLIVGVAINAGKKPLFTLEERTEIMETMVSNQLNGDGSKIEIRPFDCLLMDFAIQNGARVIVRGLRAVSDFEYEFQMAGMNARLNKEVETVFLMASDNHQFIASRFVKEIARLGGEIGAFVAPAVAKKVREKVAKREPDRHSPKKPSKG